ncbi:hypothetical protein O181_020214 [Austropuccinia psidii MF-1]|uniref:Uncharacterized protein n=1 Tax=Austropuccinia psidii MF-1 TaxID=1389203 RepID=A0A9Q3CAW2_9BASI|nr:hypothetical protein [Austropuccinia psidii MF-1]
MAYQPPTDCLEDGIIQTLGDIIRRFCAYGQEFKDPDGFTNHWCTLIPALELEYKASINYSTRKTPETLEKGWNTRILYNTIKKDLVSQPQVMTLLHGCFSNPAWNQGGANWPQHIFYGQFPPFGNLWPFGHNTFPWPVMASGNFLP